MTETAALLDTLHGYYGKYVVLTDDQRIAVALWTLHTHVVQLFSTTPYLIVTSAEKRSGKSRLLETLLPVCANAHMLTAPTEAVLFRIVAKAPTLLIDETDAIFNHLRGQPSERQEALRGILNAGYRKGMNVGRCAAGTHEVEWWPVYGPKALAGIGRLPSTLEDRGLNIRLSRRLMSEPVESFRYDTGQEWGIRLLPRIEAWAPTARLQLASVRPDMPRELDDRAQDAYEPLIAIADYASAMWGERARVSLVALRNVDSDVRESVGVRLFNDLASFRDRLRMERIATHDLLAWLYEHGDEPWEDWWGESAGKKASRRLAMTLAEYDVRPEQYKEDGEKKRGYRVDALLGALDRWHGIQERVFMGLGGVTPGVEHGTSVPSALPEGLPDSQHGTGLEGGYRVDDSGNPHGYAEGTEVPCSDTMQTDPQPVSDPERGSVAWIGQASMDELRAWQDDLDTPENT